MDLLLHEKQFDVAFGLICDYWKAVPSDKWNGWVYHAWLRGSFHVACMMAMYVNTECMPVFVSLSFDRVNYSADWAYYSRPIVMANHDELFGSAAHDPSIGSAGHNHAIGNDLPSPYFVILYESYHSRQHFTNCEQHNIHRPSQTWIKKAQAYMHNRVQAIADTIPTMPIVLAQLILLF
jgi:hypothetical protein